MINKKAQAQIITVVIIILLVLAAVFIVWRAIQKTIAEGSEQISEQSRCIGINLEIIKASDLVFHIKRTGSGGSFNEVDVAVLVDDVRLGKDTGYALSNSSLLEGPLGTGTITFDSGSEPVSKLEVALIGDGITCPAIAKLEF